MNKSIVIYRDEDGYEVWCGVDGDNIINAHIIGIGPTRDEAVLNAVEDLQSSLHNPSGAARCGERSRRPKDKGCNVTPCRPRIS